MKIILLIFYILIVADIHAQKHEVQWGEISNCIEINSSSNDFAPSWNSFDKKLYFNSDRSGVSKFYLADETNDLLEFDKLLDADINSGSNNRSYITFLSDEKAYITSYNNINGFPTANIFTTKIHKNQWSQQFLVEDINTNDFNSQPSVSPNGDILVLVSNRQNSDLDTDIWMAYKRDDGLWSSLDPCNKLNSPGNEITPYLKSSDTLFFASDGLGGNGGFDIYMSIRQDGSWQRPQPVSELNTEFDESDMTFINDHAVVFASNRPGGLGKLDLYTCSFRMISLDEIDYSEPEISFTANNDVIKIDHSYEYDNKSVVNFAIIKNTDSILFDRSFQIIAEKLLLSDSGVLNFYINDSNPAKVFEDLTTFLLNDFGLDDSKVIIHKNSEIPADIIKFSSDQKELFEPVEIITNTIKFEFDQLKLSIDARPREVISDWTCYLTFDDLSTQTIKTGKRLPEVFDVDLSKFKNKILTSDNLHFELLVNDSKRKKHLKNIQVILSKSEVKKKSKISNSDGKYSYNDLFVSDEIDIISQIENNREIFSYSKKIIIQYFDMRSEKLAETFVERLKKECKTEMISKELIDDKVIDINSNFIQYYFRLLY